MNEEKYRTKIAGEDRKGKKKNVAIYFYVINYDVGKMKKSGKLSFAGNT